MGPEEVQEGKMKVKGDSNVCQIAMNLLIQYLETKGSFHVFILQKEKIKRSIGAQCSSGFVIYCPRMKII